MHRESRPTARGKAAFDSEAIDRGDTAGILCPPLDGAKHMSSNWYFAKSGVSNGPVSLEDLHRDLQSGVLGPETLVWNPSIPNWRPASEMAELRVSPPPLPTSHSLATKDSTPATMTKSIQGSAVSASWPPLGPESSPPQNPRQIGPDGLYSAAPSRSFREAISICFNEYLTFSGRASRSEYWFFYLFTVLMGVVCSLLDAFGTGGRGAPFSLIHAITLTLPYLAVTVRRLHDTERSGWWLIAPPLGLIAIVLIFTLIGAGAPSPDALAAPFLVILGLGYFGWAIALTVILCFKGTPGPNRFG